MNIRFHWPQIGNMLQQQLLQRHVARASLAHAYLLHGPQGIGKTDIALLFARSILCEKAGRPCRDCESCVMFEKGIHPDVLRVERLPATAAITVDQVRALSRFAHLRPVRSPHKIALVFEADSMNALAANAFLKTLEEPPAHMIIVLVAHRLNTIPATVLSRCQLVAMTALPDDDVRAMLAEEEMTDAQKESVVQFSRGRIGIVRDMLRDRFESFQRKLDAAFRFLEGKPADQILLVHEWIRNVKDRDSTATAFAISRESFDRLNYLEVIVRDVLIGLVRRPSSVANPHGGRLRGLEQRYSVRQLSAILRGIASLRAALSRNANAQLVWEHFLISTIV